VDPKDKTPFSYYLTQNRKKFQLMAFLENDQDELTLNITQTNAEDLSNRVPTVYGKKI
jgi:hypothetical protein